jgi:hypothetical protein
LDGVAEALGGRAVNRWRQRLAELHGVETAASARAVDVQNVQNVQNSPSEPAFEHFEQIEQRTEKPRAAPTWSEAEDERAAIVEYDGGVPRTWAEGFARLDRTRPPRDVPPQRWRRFVDDVGRFLDSEFCAPASALGWGPHDLFGCDRDRPFARIDQCGLLWLVNGDRLVALSENTATIETRSGARQIWRRKPSEPGRVLAWELGQ